MEGNQKNQEEDFMYEDDFDNYKENDEEPELPKYIKDSSSANDEQNDNNLQTEIKDNKHIRIASNSLRNHDIIDLSNKINSFDNVCGAQKLNSVNLINFDSFNRSVRINSPRSLEVCLSNGIDPLDLYHKSYDIIKSILSLMQRHGAST